MKNKHIVNYLESLTTIDWAKHRNEMIMDHKANQFQESENELGRQIFTVVDFIDSFCLLGLLSGFGFGLSD